MAFGYITLAVAFLLSAVAAYYSVLGLVAIFSAAVIPVMIMGGALETGKVIAAMWLHRNWHRAPWSYKAYLLPSLLALMLLTSMGTFGYLSKAHSDQSLVSGDVTSKIAIYDEKIRISRENIDANRAALKQLDAAVDQIMGRSTTESGAERSVQIRRQQGPERQRLIREIEAEQKKISDLNEARAPIAAEVRKVEAEVGPIKYIAALIYGDNPENNLLESAVRWVIILIVSVFDPLAIVLILAGTRHLEWERQQLALNKVPVESSPAEVEIKPIEQPQPVVINEPEPQPPPRPEPMVAAAVRHDYLYKPGVHKVPGIDVGPQVYKKPIEQVEEKPDVRLNGDGYVLYNSKNYSLKSFIDLFPDLAGEVTRLKQKKADDILKADNVQAKAETPATFGNKFPDNPAVNHMHVHTGVLPSKLYQFNGYQWLEVDKSVSDKYTHNSAYTQYLIGKLEDKTINLDDLSPGERNMIVDYIRDNKNV